jgi:hypothetical protein
MLFHSYLVIRFLKLDFRKGNGYQEGLKESGFDKLRVDLLVVGLHGDDEKFNELQSGRAEGDDFSSVLASDLRSAVVSDVFDDVFKVIDQSGDEGNIIAQFDRLNGGFRWRSIFRGRLHDLGGVDEDVIGENVSEDKSDSA